MNGWLSNIREYLGQNVDLCKIFGYPFLKRCTLLLYMRELIVMSKPSQDPGFSVVCEHSEI